MYDIVIANKRKKHSFAGIVITEFDVSLLAKLYNDKTASSLRLFYFCREACEGEHGLQ